MIEDILSQVQKPGRYIGREWNVAKKDFAKSDIKFALCFPDLYEIGMSNLGIRILYAILNNIKDVCCERFFAPDIDMEKLLRSRGIELFSLESARALKEFDIAGFSLGYELNYTNVLNMLDTASIPPEASLRDHRHPLIIGGGPCVMNPEPMADFFDLFVIGEAEEAICELLDVYRRLKQEFRAGKISKQDLLIEFSHIEGVYVPALYKVGYDAQGRIDEFKPLLSEVPPTVKKRFIKDLDSAYFPVDWIVPYIQTVHDRISLEIMRGCPNKCRFCQAKAQYFPFRKREPGKVLDLACDTYRRSGYEELSLAGLSVSDYPQIEGLTQSLVDTFKEKGVSVSLPSLKYRMMVGNLSGLIATVKKTGLTFAPEAGTERLRGIIGKDFDEAGFLQALRQIYAAGYRHVKLYFMIGLPYEEKEDLDAIVDFSLRVSEIRRQIKNAPAQVNVSINTLIPKPHTPLQWFKMDDPEEIMHKQEYLRGRFKNKRYLKLNLHNCRMSFLEGVLSRGDRRLSRVILAGFRAGCRFDAWGNYFNFNLWQEAFAKNGIDPEFYLEARTADEFLPWDFLDVGIGKEVLCAEFNKPVAR